MLPRTFNAAVANATYPSRNTLGSNFFCMSFLLYRDAYCVRAPIDGKLLTPHAVRFELSLEIAPKRRPNGSDCRRIDRRAFRIGRSCGHSLTIRQRGVADTDAVLGGPDRAMRQ